MKAAGGLWLALLGFLEGGWEKSRGGKRQF